jgi:hypothetical protein
VNDQSEAKHAQRTRRTVLTGAAAATVASVLARGRAAAAPGDPVLQGRNNDAGATRTTLSSSAPSSTLRVINTAASGLVATSSNRDSFAIYAQNNAGRAGAGAGMRVECRKGDGIQGRSFVGTRAGVFGLNTTRNQNAVGVVGRASVGVAGVARTRAGFGLVSVGRAFVSGNLFVNGRIFQGGTSAGTSELDASGSAVVDAEAASDAVYDYQLTAVGVAMPNLHVVEGPDGSFTIKGGKPGGRVSWQRTARAEPELTAQSVSVEQLPDLSAYLEE